MEINLIEIIMLLIILVMHGIRIYRNKYNIELEAELRKSNDKTLKDRIELLENENRKWRN